MKLFRIEWPCAACGQTHKMLLPETSEERAAEHAFDSLLLMGLLTCEMVTTPTGDGGWERRTKIPDIRVTDITDSLVDPSPEAMLRMVMRNVRRPEMSVHQHEDAWWFWNGSTRVGPFEHEASAGLAAATFSSFSQEVH